MIPSAVAPGTDARPSLEHIRSNSGDRRCNASSATALIVRSGWSFGTRPSMSTKASIISWGSRLLRIERVMRICRLSKHHGVVEEPNGHSRWTFKEFVLGEGVALV